jgi:diaminopimelate epimerase
MKFTKMHGTGNDYIYVNGFTETIDNPVEFAIKYSDRHKGIGSDGLVMISTLSTILAGICFKTSLPDNEEGFPSTKTV